MLAKHNHIADEHQNENIPCDMVVRYLDLISTETFRPPPISMASEIGTSSFIVIRDSFGANNACGSDLTAEIELKFQFPN